MLRDWAAIDGQELWNTTRTDAYLGNVGSPFFTGPDICTCQDLTATILGESFVNYRTPALDPAPWYDAGLAVSGEYLGFVPLSVTGVDDNPQSRTVTNAVGGGGVFGPVRDLPRTITVSGLVLGSTCCGADYGLQYLREVLAGCTGGICDGGCLQMYDCCPELAVTPTPQAFNAAHRRTFRRSALVSGPTLIRRDGTSGCSRPGCVGGDILTVEFVLVAATPWAWTDPIDLLSVTLPAVGLSPCINWCLINPVTMTGGCDPSECLFADCTETDACADPLHAVPTPPQPTSPPASFCVPLGTERACYNIDLSTRPQWSSDAPTIVLTSGANDLRNVRILLFEKPAGTLLSCDGIADANRCDPQNQWIVTYLKAGGSITLDGQISRALTSCNGVCSTSTTVYSDQDGGPARFNLLTCANYCLCIETDPAYPVAADAMLQFSVSGRGY